MSDVKVEHKVVMTRAEVAQWLAGEWILEAEGEGRLDAAHQRTRAPEGDPRAGYDLRGAILG